MRKLIRYIKSKILLVSFLLWHDKQTRPTTKWIVLTSAGLIGTLWSFPLDNVLSSGVMPSEIKKIIRTRGTCLLLSICLTLLFVLLWICYKKYSSDKLTEKELDNFLHHMNKSK